MMTKEEFASLVVQAGISMDMKEMVGYIEQGQVLAKDVFFISIDSQNSASWYASWILNHYIDKNHNAIAPYLDAAIVALQAIERTGHRRLLLRYFMVTSEWDEYEHLGLLLDICLRIIQDTTSPSGLTANAMSVVDRIAEKEPDIKNEVLVILEEQLPYLATGAKNRANKIIKKYSK